VIRDASDRLLKRARKERTRERAAEAAVLDLSLEVVRRDAKPISHIEPVRRCAVGSDAGVEMKALAAETLSLLGQPVHELLAVPERRAVGIVETSST
jgi:hypothetical protein